MTGFRVTHHFETLSEILDTAISFPEVPGRTQGRQRKGPSQEWVLLRYLAAISLENQTSLPMNVLTPNEDRSSPDFEIWTNGQIKGIEITQAIDQQYSHACAIAERLNKPPPDLSLFGNGKKFSDEELVQLVQNETTGDGFVGNYNESRCAELVLEAVEAKLIKFGSGNYRRYSHQSLVVYDNSGYVVRPHHVVDLVAGQLPTVSERTFDELYVLSGGAIARIPWRKSEGAIYSLPRELVAG